MSSFINNFFIMKLSARLINLRREMGLTQQKMADTIDIHVNSIKKYEAGQALPSLDVLKKIAVTLHISTDFLLFEEHERSPNADFALQFEAVSQMPEGEQLIVKEVLESLIIKSQTRRWDTSRRAASG